MRKQHTGQHSYPDRYAAGCEDATEGGSQHLQYPLLIEVLHDHPKDNSGNRQPANASIIAPT